MDYSPIFLLDFDEVEYALAPIKWEDGHDAPGQGNKDIVGHGDKLPVGGVVVAGGTNGVEYEGENHFYE